MSWRENTRSKPTSLPSAVSTAVSSTRHRAGSGRPHGGVGEQRGDRRGVGRAAAVAEREQPAAGARSARPSPPATRVDAASPRARSVAARERRRCRRPWPAPSRRGRRAAAGTSRSSPSRNGYRKSVIARHSGPHRCDGDRRSPCRRGRARGRRRAPVRRAWCRPSRRPRRAHGRQAVARRPSSTSAGRPSSEQVTQTRRPRSVVGGSASRPGCSKQTWVSSHSTWYSRTTEPSWRAAPDRSTRRPTARGRRRRRAGGRRRRSRPSSTPTPRRGAAASAAAPSVSASPIDARARRRRGRRRAARRRDRPRRSTPPGSARLPTMTGWTNSTATWRACSGQCGATHHIVAPAANRRATSSAAAARSAPTSACRSRAVPADRRLDRGRSVRRIGGPLGLFRTPGRISAGPSMTPCRSGRGDMSRRAHERRGGTT